MPRVDAAMEGLRIAARGRGEMRAQTSVRIEKAALKLTQQQTEADTSLGSFTPIHAVTETAIFKLTSHKLC